MASGDDKSNDFYGVLGLKKECSATELRNAYKKLALRWHPDRCSASGNSKFVEEAKKKFQTIQEAYSVLSDANKRFMYDVGAYNSDDDENGMGDFLGEMAMMMSQTEPSGNAEESFEELQDLFEEMFQRDVGGFASSSQNTNVHYPSSNFSHSTYSNSNSNNKQHYSDMNSGKTNYSDMNSGKTNYSDMNSGKTKGDGGPSASRGL